MNAGPPQEGQEHMRGLRITGDRRAELVRVPRPDARPGWVVLRSTRSAVCGSDLHNYRQAAARLGERAQRIAGHEAVGVVEQVGAGVDDLHPGDRVVVYQHYGCGRCRFCRTGEPMFCRDRRTLGNHVDGADAEFVAAPAPACLRLPETLSDAVGALLACNFGTAASGVRKLGIGGADVVAVFGLGPVGCSAVLVAAGRGADVVAVDPVAKRRALAERMGALRTVDPTVEDVAQVVAGLTAGRGAEASVDCSGSPRAQAQALALLRPNGAMMVLAATAPWTLDPSQLWRRGLTLRGSWVYALGEYEAVVRLAERHAAALEQLVTRSFPGAEAEEAVRAADAGSEGKVLIDWTR
jgi:threonine dehydrogenase-like Zn-dependent dehydrogenase